MLSPHQQIIRKVLVVSHRTHDDDFVLRSRLFHPDEHPRLPRNFSLRVSIVPIRKKRHVRAPVNSSDELSFWHRFKDGDCWSVPVLDNDHNFDHCFAKSKEAGDGVDDFYYD